MPTQRERDEDETPKSGYKLRSHTRRKKQLEPKCGDTSDSDSDSDYDPEKDETEDMNTRDLQRFIQKIFPSKNGKDRLKQLDKLR